MEEFRIVVLETVDSKLNAKIKELNGCYFRNQKVFAKVCYKIYDISRYCANNSFAVVERGCKRQITYKAKDIFAEFGFSPKEIDRYISCYRKFIIASCIDDAVVIPIFELFSPGKLYEMLPYSYDMLCVAIKNNDIHPEMSCKEIRAALKDISGRTDKTSKVYEDLNMDKSLEVQEEETVSAYDPDERHDLEYFKHFDKATLIDFLFMAEDYILKLKKKKK